MLVDKFGWPGVLVGFVIWLVEHDATVEQRRAIIDLYVLGKGLQAVYPLVFMGGLFLLVSLAQRYSYRKKLKLLEDEIQRIGGAKSAKQERALGTSLHHVSLPEQNG